MKNNRLTTVRFGEKIARYSRWWLTWLLSLLIVGCSFSQSHSERYEIEKDGPDYSSKKDPGQVKNATPKWEPKSKYGNPPSYEVFGKRYYVMKSSEGYKQKGIASWYGRKFHGKRTSSGEPYDMYAMSAAHKNLPLPSYAKVTNLRNGKQVIIRINDRGPFHDNRLIDLSYSAAYQLGMIAKGTALVEVETINPSRWQAQQQSQKNSSPAGGGLPSKTPSTAPSTPSKQQAKASAPVYQAKIYIQVGAFASMLNAQKLLKQLNAQYPKQAFINQTMVHGKRFSRVRLGPINTVEQADDMAQRLLNNGHKATRIVVE